MKRILLDMDGVLCDYDNALDNIGARKPNGKSDWGMLAEIGHSYWADMDWMSEGQKLYRKLVKLVAERDDVELGILSAIFLPCGKLGKKEWLAQHCPEIPKKNIIICQKGIEKWKWGDEKSILVDDKDENVALYEEFTGPAVLFQNADQAYADILNLLES